MVKQLESVVRNSIFKITPRFWVLSTIYYFLFCNLCLFLLQKTLLAGSLSMMEILIGNLILILPGLMIANHLEKTILERRRQAYHMTMTFIRTHTGYQVVEVQKPTFWSKLSPRIWREAISSQERVSVECYFHMDRKFAARLYYTGIVGFFAIKFVAIPAHVFQDIQRQGRANMESPQRVLTPNPRPYSKG
ncbi:hypothetical protein [Bdellovibrio sp. HCB337]|uniref:hypothetical protein n=1 Tax=Bdellovibrio sp. HCB337 TaxID=3394358 RepID=UPI0039A400AF